MTRDWSRRGWVQAGGAAWLAPLLACSTKSPAPNGDAAVPQSSTAPPAPDTAQPTGAAPVRDGSLSLVGSRVGEYCDAHSVPESAAMRAIYEETRRTEDMWIMMVGPVEAALLRLLVQLSGARRVLEVGTFTGYSAIAMAEGLPPDGEVVTLDISEEWTAIAKRHWATSPHGKKIRLVLGPAGETLKTLASPFDVAFVDADKGSYPAYWDAIVPMMRPGGLVICDNVLAGGRVAAPGDERARRMDAFNRKVAEDARVQPIMLPIRDGVSISRVV